MSRGTGRNPSSRRSVVARTADVHLRFVTDFRAPLDRSRAYQGDEALAAAAIHALRDEPVGVIVTLADAHGTAELPSAPNARVERFVAHGTVLDRAAAVVCHAGMGIVQKAIAAGVPIAAVPFGRDQPESHDASRNAAPAWCCPRSG